MNTVKEFATFIPSLILHAVNLLLWKKILSLTLFKIITASRPSTLLKVFLMGKSGCPNNRGNRGGELPLPAKKFELLPSVRYTLTKKSPIAFRQVLPKFFPATCIFSYTIITYSKSSLELNPIIQTSRIISQNYTLCIPLYALIMCGLSSLPPNLFLYMHISTRRIAFNK